MAQNPYAAPNPQPPMAPMGGPAMGGPAQPWSVGEAINFGWEAVKRWFVPLVFANGIAMFLGGSIGQIPNILQQSGIIEPGTIVTGVVSIVFGLVGFLVGAFFQVGQLRLFLQAARGQEPDFMLVFSGADRFVPMAGVTLLVAIATALGLIALVVPGIIVILGLGMASIFCVDKNMGVMESLRASWNVTTGHKMDLLLYGIVAVIFMFLSMLACCVGYFVAMPLLWVGWVFIYMRLTGQPVGGPPQGGFGGPPQDGFGGPPQGGFGGPPQGGFGGPPQGGFGGPPQGGFGGPPQGGFGGPPQGGFGGPPQGGGAPPGGGYGPPPGGGG